MKPGGKLEVTASRSSLWLQLRWGGRSPSRLTGFQVPKDTMAQRTRPHRMVSRVVGASGTNETG